MLKSTLTSRPLSASPPVYPEDLEPALQTTLAVLAGIDAQYEEAREQLARWTGPEALKERFASQLEESHREERRPVVQRLAELHQEMMSLTLYRGIDSKH